MTNNRPLSFLCGLAAAALLLVTGCGEDGAASAPTASPTPTSNSFVEPGFLLPTPPASSSGKTACPVDAATLETAFKANTTVAEAIVLGNGLRDVVCYQDYAVARTSPTQTDSATVVFVYNSATGAWKAVTAGTDVDCTPHGIPASAVQHLPGCRTS